ncbi:hypothetical protein CLV37_106227 [Kineococcus rhizosphaerae]|uniref:Uncharacterized protein n=1 Tax=Kineococcus rhizosphaerae TaxID=559628 RepID=A0A2T0R3L7_9ACTN|nr:hypothetical protein CLV37_106227 [Kineococcus rhizosphaerae]
MRDEHGRVLRDAAGGETTDQGTPVATTPEVDLGVTGPREGVPVADLAGAVRPPAPVVHR